MERPPGRLLYSEQTPQGRIEVVEHQFTRGLYFGNEIRQTEILHDQPEILVLRYAQSMMASLLFNANPKSVLMIGLGGGTLASFLHNYLPEIHLTLVEQRPEVVDVAREYFGLPQGERVEIEVGDGSVYVAAKKGVKTFDLVLIDAFSPDGMAPTLLNKSFYGNCRALTSAEGVIAVNVWQTQPKQARQIRSYMDKVFSKQTWSLPVTDKGNEIVLASRRSRDTGTKEIKQLAELLQQKTGLDFPDMCDRMVKT